MMQLDGYILCPGRYRQSRVIGAVVSCWTPKRVTPSSIPGYSINFSFSFILFFHNIPFANKNAESISKGSMSNKYILFFAL